MGYCKEKKMKSARNMYIPTSLNGRKSFFDVMVVIRFTGKAVILPAFDPWQRI